MRDRILGDRAANAQQRASQRVKEVCKSFVPSVWVVQVTGVACSLHHHHFVIGQIAQVTERHLPELMVLVTVNDQRWDLYALVLLRCEFVRTDGSDRDVGSHQSLVLEEEGQGIHPA